MVLLAKVVDREKLKPRRDPYFAPLSRGCAIGLRKLSAGSEGTWVARWRDPENSKQIHKPLGAFDTMPPNERYSAALKAARKWFEHLEHGGSAQTLTIRDACEHYIEHLRRGNSKGARGIKDESLRRAMGERASKDVRRRFEQYVFNDRRFAAIEMEKLNPKDVKAWRERLEDLPTTAGTVRSMSSLNRDMTCLRSTFNLAMVDGFVASDTAWKNALVPVAKADQSRGVYLDAGQRKSLMDNADNDLATFIRAQCLLPVRPGAMAQLKVGDFDARLGTIRVRSDKANAGRTVQLPSSTAAFFAQQAANKLPAAWLFSRADGKPWDKDAWKGPFRTAADRAGLPAAATLYALRHSAITDLVHAGADLLTVSQIAGTGLRMIEQNYGHMRGAVAATALDSLAQQMGAA